MCKSEIQELELKAKNSKTVKEKKEFLQRIKELKLSSEVQKNKDYVL